MQSSPHEERDYANDHSTIIKGSSMLIVFTDETLHLIVGHSKEDRVWKFPCGKIEEQDHVHARSQISETKNFTNAIAHGCALREFHAEVGLSTLDLTMVSKLDYERDWYVHKHATIKDQKITQFHFVGIIAEGKELPSSVDEEDEMDIRAYWRAEEVFAQALLPRGAKDKFNPYHAMALVEALLFLRKVIAHDENFSQFHRMLESLKRNGYHIDTLKSELHDMMLEGRI